MHKLHWYLIAWTLALMVGIAGCRKSEKPKSAKKRHEEAIAQKSQEQRALSSFSAALREILQWRQSQPEVQSESERQLLVKTLAEKMTHVPVEGLSPDLLMAWESMLNAWQALASRSSSTSALQESGAQAARNLNEQMEKHGVIDIRF